MRALVYRHAATVTAELKARGDALANLPEDPFLGTAEAATESGYSRRTFQRAVAAHEIPTWRPHGRRNLFKRADVLAWSARKTSDAGAMLALPNGQPAP